MEPLKPMEKFFKAYSFLGREPDLTIDEFTEKLKTNRAYKKDVYQLVSDEFKLENNENLFDKTLGIQPLTERTSSELIFGKNDRPYIKDGQIEGFYTQKGQYYPVDKPYKAKPEEYENAIVNLKKTIIDDPYKDIKLPKDTETLEIGGTQPHEQIITKGLFVSQAAKEVASWKDNPLGDIYFGFQRAGDTYRYMMGGDNLITMQSPEEIDNLVKRNLIDYETGQKYKESLEFNFLRDLPSGVLGSLAFAATIGLAGEAAGVESAGIVIGKAAQVGGRALLSASGKYLAQQAVLGATVFGTGVVKHAQDGATNKINELEKTGRELDPLEKAWIYTKYFGAEYTKSASELLSEALTPEIGSTVSSLKALTPELEVAISKTAGKVATQGWFKTLIKKGPLQGIMELGGEQLNDAIGDAMDGTSTALVTSLINKGTITQESFQNALLEYFIGFSMGTTLAGIGIVSEETAKKQFEEKLINKLALFTGTKESAEELVNSVPETQKEKLNTELNTLLKVATSEINVSTAAVQFSDDRVASISAWIHKGKEGIETGESKTLAEVIEKGITAAYELANANNSELGDIGIFYSESSTEALADEIKKSLLKNPKVQAAKADILKEMNDKKNKKGISRKIRKNKADIAANTAVMQAIGLKDSENALTKEEIEVAISEAYQTFLPMEFELETEDTELTRNLLSNQNTSETFYMPNKDIIHLDAKKYDTLVKSELAKVDSIGELKNIGEHSGSFVNANDGLYFVEPGGKDKYYIRKVVPLFKKEEKQNTKGYTKTKPKTINANSIKGKPSRLSEVIPNMKEKLGIETTPLLDFITERFKDTSEEPFIFWVSDPNEFNGHAAKVKHNLKENRSTIYLNLDYLSQNQGEIYTTVLHEMVHALTIPALLVNSKHYDASFDEAVTNIRELTIANMNEDYNITSDYLENNFEFLAGAFGDSTELQRLLRDVIVEEKSLVSRVIDAIRKLFKKILKKDQSTLMEHLEFLMFKKFGAPYEFTKNFDFKVTDADVSLRPYEESVLIDDLLDAMDKIQDLDSLDIDDQKLFVALAKMVGPTADYLGKPIYEVLQDFTFEELYDKITKTEEWDGKLKARYKREGQYTSVDMEEYQRRIVKQLFNRIQNVRYVEHIEIKQAHVLGEDSVETNVISLPEIFMNEHNSKTTSYTSDMMVFQIIERISEHLGIELEPVMISHVKHEYFYSVEDEVPYRTTSSKLTKQVQLDNAFYTGLLKEKGYAFLGTFADKAKAIAIKLPEGFTLDALNEIIAVYSENLKKITSALANQKREEILSQKEAEGIAPVLSEDDIRSIQTYISRMSIKPEFDIPNVLRMLVEDIKLGAFKTGEFQSLLFQTVETEKGLMPGPRISWDIINLFKRAYPVSPMYSAVPSIEEIEKYNNQGNGVTSKGDIRTVVFNSTSFPEADVNGEPINYMIKLKGIPFEVDIRKILTNEYGISGVDGAAFYLIKKEKNGFDEYYREVHGATNEGTIKAFINHDIDFNEDAYYIKTAFHGIPEDSPLGQWMLQKNIGLLIADESAKINERIPQVELFGNIEEVYELPFTRIHRITEKGKVKKEAKGFAQMITANFATENNPGMEDILPIKEFRSFVNELIEYQFNEFNKELDTFDGTGVLEYLREKNMSTLNAHQNNALNLLAPYLKDKFLDEITSAKEKKEFAETLEESIAAENELNQLLYEQKIQDLRLTDRLRIFLNHPYFANLIENAIRGKIESLNKFTVRGSHLTLGPDLGYLSNIHQHIRGALTSLVLEEVNLNAETQLTGKDSKVQEIVESRLKKIIDLETGRLKKGYAAITSDFAKIHNVKVGERIIHNAVPSNNFTAAGSSIVVAILPVSSSEKGKIYLNSEYIQGVVGKDYDIDTLLVIPNSKSFSNFDKIASSLEKINEHMVDKTYQTFLNLLGPEIVTSKSDIFRKDVRLKYIQKFNVAVTGTDIFNPFTEDMYVILDKFKKSVGDAITRRKNFQLFTDIGLEINLQKKKLGIVSTVHPNSFRVHLLHSELTESRVDMPTNTSVFYYAYDEVEATAQDMGLTRMVNGEFQIPNDKISTVEEFHKAFRVISNFLFGNAYSLFAESYEESPVLIFQEVLNKINQQKLINKLLREGDHTTITDLFTKYLYSARLSKNFIDQILPMAKEILYNINYSKLNLSNSSMLSIIDRYNFSTFPEFGMSWSQYEKTENNALYDILNSPRAKQFLEHFQSIVNDPQYSQFVKISSSYYEKLDGRDVGIERLLTGLYLFTTRTTVNGDPTMDYHLLKAKLLETLNPNEEMTKEAFESYKKMSHYQQEVESGKQYLPATMAIKARAELYPKFFNEFLKAQIIDFKGVVKDPIILTTPDGDITLVPIQNDTDFIIRYKGEKYTRQQLMEGAHKKLKNLLTGENHIWNGNNRRLLSNFIRIYSKVNMPAINRVELATNMINEFFDNQDATILNKKELAENKMLFWLSLMGVDPKAGQGAFDQNGKYKSISSFSNFRNPIGVVRDSKRARYATNDLLLEVMNNTKDPQKVNKILLQSWRESWVKNYHGTIWSEYKKDVRSMEQDLSIDEFVFYRPKSKTKKDSDILKERVNIFDMSKTVYDIGEYENKKADPRFLYDQNSVIPAVITRKGVMTVSGKEIIDHDQPAELKNTKKKINAAHILKYRTDALRTAFEQSETSFSERLKRIRAVIKENQTGGLSMEDIWAKIHETIETNTEMEILSKDVIELPQEYINSVLDKEETGYIIRGNLYNKTTAITALSQAEGIPEFIASAVIELQEYYAVEVPQLMSIFSNYAQLLKETMRNAPKRRKDMFNAYLRRMNMQMEAIKQRQGKYIPHIVSKSMYEDTVKPYLFMKKLKELKKQALYQERMFKEGRRDIDIELVKNAHNEKYLISRINEELNSNAYNMFAGQGHTVIDTNFLERTLPEEIEFQKTYDISTARPHQIYFNNLWKMLLTNTDYLNFVAFENEAEQANFSRRSIIAVAAKMASGNRHRLMNSVPIHLDDVKPGMEINAYITNTLYTKDMLRTTEEDLLLGIVEEVTSDTIKLKVNEVEKEALLKKKLNKYRAVDQQITVRDFNPIATHPQKNLIRTLRDKGYNSISEVELNKLNRKQASDLIIQGIELELRDKKNWGRYKKSELYMYNYNSDGKSVKVRGARRFMVKDSIFGLAETIALEMSNRNPNGVNSHGQAMLKWFSGLSNKADRAITLAYLGNLPSALRNRYYANSAMFTADPYEYIKQFRKKYNWLTPRDQKSYNSFIKEVETAVKNGDFEKFNNSMQNPALDPASKKYELKKKIMMELALEQGLFNDIEIMRIVTESGIFEEMLHGTKSMSVKTLIDILYDKSGYKEYKDKLAVVTDELYNATDFQEVKKLRIKQRAIQLEWEYHKRDLDEQFTGATSEKELDRLRNVLQERLEDPEFESETFYKTALEKIEIKDKKKATYLYFKLLSHTISSNLLGLFGSAEKANRLNTLVFAINKLVDQGETDIESIKQFADNLIEITQAKYDEMSRRIGDKPGLARTWYKFGQYQNYQYKLTGRMIKQGYEQSGQSLTQFAKNAITGLFSPVQISYAQKRLDFIEKALEKASRNKILTKTESQNIAEKAGNDFDSKIEDKSIPVGEINIPAMLSRQILADSILMNVNALFPGLNLIGNPIARIVNLSVGVLFQGILEDFDFEDMDTWEVGLSILSIFFGWLPLMGYQLTKSLLDDGEIERWEIEPSTVKYATYGFGVALDNIWGMDENQNIISKGYSAAKLERAVLGANFLLPRRSDYYTEPQEYYFDKYLHERLFLIPQSVIPYARKFYTLDKYSDPEGIPWIAR